MFLTELNSMQQFSVRKFTALLTIRGISGTFLWYKWVIKLEIESSNVTDVVPIEIVT
jgi:hypothetical protein